ncbi:MAG: hypothetical protein ABWZ77_04210 [Naasia sp.]
MNRTSLQQLDPIGALAGQRLTLTASAAVVLLSVIACLFSGGETDSTVAAVLSSILFAGAAGVLARAVARGNGLLGQTIASSVLALGALGLLAAVVGVVGAPLDGSQWAPYAVAILLLALVPYRPVAEIVISSVLLAVWTVLAVTFGASTVDEAPAGFRQIAAALPVLALPLGGVAFSSHVLQFLASWRRTALDAAAEEVREQEGAITRVVQQTRVTILNRDVVPFFADLAARGEIDSGDRERARQLAESIRTIMVADIDRSWLEELVHPRDPLTGRSAGSSSVEDPEELAHLMDLDQRAALRAFLGLLGDLAGDHSAHLEVALATDLGVCEVRIVSRLGVSEREARSALRPYLAVMATVFSDIGFQFRDNILTMRFCYDRP